MSDPTSNDENSEHQMYAPWKLQQEQTRLPAAPQLRIDSPPVSPSRTQLQGDWRSPSSGGGLENETVSQPLPQRRSYSALTLFAWLAIVASCTAVLIMVIAATPKPFWQGLGPQRDTGSETSQASTLSDRFVLDKTAATGVTGTAAPSEAQQSSAPAQQARLAPPEQKSINTLVRGVTDNEIRFGISAPFSGPAKELGQNMKLGIDAAFNVANTNGGVHGRQLRLIAVDDGYEPTRTAETMKQLYDKIEFSASWVMSEPPLRRSHCPTRWTAECCFMEHLPAPTCSGVIPRTATFSTIGPATPRRPTLWCDIWSRSGG